MRRAGALAWLAILTIAVSSCAFLGLFDTDEGIPKEEVEAILDTQQEAASMLTQFLESEDPNPVQAVVTWMQSQPLVVDAQVTASGNIEILYECGLSAWIMTSPMGVSPASISLSTPGRVPREPLGRHPAAIPKASEQGKEALILLPHNTELGTPASLSSFVDQLRLCGYTVDDPIIDDDASLELFGDIGNYELVYIITHGNAHELSLIHQTALATGTKADPNWFVRTGKRIWEIGIEVMTMKNGEHYLAVNGRFFADLTYSGTAVIANACESLKYDVLAGAFLDNGAQCFIGWTEVSNMHLVNIATTALAQALADGASTLSAIWDTPTEFSVGSWGSNPGVIGSHTLDELFPRCFGSGLGENCPDYAYAGNPSFSFLGTSAAVQVSGKALLEGGTDHSGIVVTAIWGGFSGNVLDTTTTTSDGSYRLGIPGTMPDGEDWFHVQARKVGYSSDSYGLFLPQEPSGLQSIVEVPDMELRTQKRLEFDWVFQPDDTRSFVGTLASGTVTVWSPIARETGDLGRPHSFNFATEEATGICQGPVVCFADFRDLPYSLIVNGPEAGIGIRDMGAIPLEEVLESPVQGYSRDIEMAVGHTYCVLLPGGSGYAKLRVVALGPGEP